MGNTEQAMIIINKSFNGSGKKLINKFIKSFSGEFEKFVINYANNSLDEDDLEHIFWFGEQQVKTAVTCALNRPCNGNFMQEPVVSRRSINTQDESDEVCSNGRVDYMCRYGTNRKISILLEVKHHWINMHRNGKHHLYSIARKRHEKAIKQLKSIEKSYHIVDHLYGAALTIVPIFTRYKTAEDKLFVINNNLIADLGQKIINETKFHACSGFVIPKNLQQITSFYDEKAKAGKFQSFPGLIMLWSLYKLTKK